MRGEKETRRGDNEKRRQGSETRRRGNKEERQGEEDKMKVVERIGNEEGRGSKDAEMTGHKRK